MTTTTIESLNQDAEGVTHIEGKVTFIENALPKETVEFEYRKKHRHYDEGKLVKIITESPDRTAPKCPHFSICGGCSLQHIKPLAQIEYKQNILLEQLKHLGGITPTEILPAIRGDYWGYRHKARIGVKYVIKKGKVLVGFREKKSGFLADLQSCAVLHPAVGERITTLSQLIQSLESYNTIPQIEIAVTDQATACVFRHMQPLSANDLEKLVLFGKTHPIHIYLQPGGPDSIQLLWPETAAFLLSYDLPAYQLQLQFRPDDFIQINPSINRQMIPQAIALLQPRQNERILDLFCGLGNFTLPLAKFAESVIGVEGSQALVARAKANALHNQLDNVAFYASNLADDCKDAAWARQTYDKILLDPPRSGAAEVIQYIKNFKAKKIVYVSCNPATLARDARELSSQGYHLTKTGVMDMFPHTTHVEAMALFEK